MLVAVFRARDDGERTANRLLALGHEALLAPVLHVVPTGAGVPSGPFDGVIFTSPHGVEGLDQGAAAVLGALPCFCVGDRTAELAAARGFRDRHNGRADAERLAALILATLAAPARLLLVAGRDRKPAIEHRLGTAGYGVIVLEAYAAEALHAWPAPAIDAFASGRVQTALHYSHRSAVLAVACATAAGVFAAFHTARHHCLSSDTAVPLHAAGVDSLVIAPEPNEASLLGTLSAWSG